jgi:carbonic anhydrase
MIGTMITPAQAWQELAEGNARFLADEPLHPRQDAERRTMLAAAQVPKATFLGCSDSRLAAEIIFDQGLGDLFVVRNAGQVVSMEAVGSLEYAVAVLGVPLVVVLAHDGCGAVRAAIDDAAPDGSPLPPLISRLVSSIRPAVDLVRTAHPGAEVDAEEVGRAHLEGTVAALLEASEIVSAGVADGSVAVVGARYRLTEGRVERLLTVGAID